jgi:hypothetical protein
LGEKMPCKVVALVVAGMEAICFPVAVSITVIAAEESVWKASALPSGENSILCADLPNLPAG